MAFDGELDTFRTKARDWLEANCPASMRTPMPEDETPWAGRTFIWKNPDSKLWLERMAQKGWTAPTWPQEYGGGGLSRAEASVLAAEMARIHARPPLASFGLWMLGPVLLDYASEAQKRTHLPRIASGEIRWCQGYSEPGAGSDLASLQTRAEDKGEHYLVNGQKVWTSYADQADWIFCLVRTAPPKHEGISFLLFDMTSPGVEARPIKLISGSSPFCETFFTDVEVPKDQLVGRPGGGWEIAKSLLQHERQNISSDGFGAGRGGDLVSVAKAHQGTDGEGRIADGDLRARVARYVMEQEAFGLTARRVAAESKAGSGVGPAASILKYLAATLNQEKHELLVEAMGFSGLGWSGEAYDPQALRDTRGWLRSKGNSIEGGTSEINLNVVAKRVLGLLDHQ